VLFTGNAPAVGGRSGLFYSAWATVYYLPGTTGWGPTYGGRPAVLWNPRITTAGASFGVRTNRFGFTIFSTNDFWVVVEASTNLVDSLWTAVATNLGGLPYFSDPQWTNYTQRFYRLRPW